MQPERPIEAFEDRLRAAPPPDWLQQMRQHYQITGGIRPEDLHRLLGDPLRRVESGPKPSLSSFLGR
jgi:hypothetical protein